MRGSAMAAFRTAKIAAICFVCMLLFFQYQKITALQAETESLVRENTALKKTIAKKTQAVKGINTYQAELETQLYETQQRLNKFLNTNGNGSPLKNGGLQKPLTTEASKKLIDLYNQPL